MQSFENPILPFLLRINQALMFDGVDDHVTLPSIHALGLTDRYVNKPRTAFQWCLCLTTFSYVKYSFPF